MCVTSNSLVSTAQKWYHQCFGAGPWDRGSSCEFSSHSAKFMCPHIFYITKEWHGLPPKKYAEITWQTYTNMTNLGVSRNGGSPQATGANLGYSPGNPPGNGIPGPAPLRDAPAVLLEGNKNLGHWCATFWGYFGETQCQKPPIKWKVQRFTSHLH